MKHIEKRNTFSILIFFLIIFSIYSPSFFNQFAYDDDETILKNHYIQSLKNVKEFFINNETISPTTNLKNEIYRPIKTFSLAVDYFLYKFNPFGYHVTNLVLHFIAVCLLYNLLILMGFSYKAQITGSLYFLVHPALSHNVAYISARADIFAGIFILLSFIFYFKSKNIKYCVLSYLCFLFACFGKETAIMLPLFLCIFVLVKRLPIRKVLPYFIIALCYLFIRQVVVKSFSQTEYYKGSFLITQAVMLKVWVIYIVGFFWPLKTDIIPVIGLENTLLNLRSAGALMFLFSTGYIVKKLKNKNIWFYLGFIWFIVFLIPVSNIVPIKAFMSWRFVYISWIGFSFVVAAFINDYSKIRFLKFIIIAWLLALSVYSFEISKQYKNDLSLWQPLTVKYPFISKPYRVTGIYYLNKNNPDMALYYFKEGLKRFPKNDYLLLDMAKYNIYCEKYSNAIEYFDKISTNMKKKMGEALTYHYLYCWYHLEDFKSIVENTNMESLKNAPVKNMMIQAHSMVLLNKFNQAKKIYRELLSRKLSKNQRMDCENILALINKEENRTQMNADSQDLK